MHAKTYLRATKKAKKDLKIVKISVTFVLYLRKVLDIIPVSYQYHTHMITVDSK